MLISIVLHHINIDYFIASCLSYDFSALSLGNFKATMNGGHPRKYLPEVLKLCANHSVGSCIRFTRDLQRFKNFFDDSLINQLRISCTDCDLQGFTRFSSTDIQRFGWFTEVYKHRFTEIYNIYYTFINTGLQKFLTEIDNSQHCGANPNQIYCEGRIYDEWWKN